MKLVVQAFVLGIFAFGASAAITSSHSSVMIANHQAVVSAFPTPTCGPGHCPPGQGLGLR
jgi:hypothetical protein